MYADGNHNQRGNCQATVERNEHLKEYNNKYQRSYPNIEARTTKNTTNIYIYIYIYRNIKKQYRLDNPNEFEQYNEHRTKTNHT